MTPRMGTKGTWWIRSKSDDRWNRSGVIAIPFEKGAMPEECERELRTLERVYGGRPSDLTWGVQR